MDLAQLTDHPGLRGIAFKHCCVAHNGDFEIEGLLQAHAHIDPGVRRGWICLRSMREYNATTVRHELAHVLSGEREHNLAWARVVRDLGGRPEAQYREGLRKEALRAAKHVRRE